MGNTTGSVGFLYGFGFGFRLEFGAMLAFKSRASYCGWRGDARGFYIATTAETTWSSGCIKLEYRLRSWS